MREYSRYKIFKTGYNLNFLPIRMLNLKRPKWDFAKLKIKRLKVLKNGQSPYLNFFKLFNTKKLLVFLKSQTRKRLFRKSVVFVFNNAQKSNRFKK